MSQRIATAVLQLVTDSADFDKKVADTEKKTENLQKRFEGLAKAGGIVAGAGLAMGAALVAMAQSAGTAGDAANDASQRLGVTTEKLAGLQLASKLADTSFEALSTGMGKLAGKASDAAKGNTAAAKTFSDLGIKVTDANGKLKPMDGLLAEVSDKFATMKDGSAKTALAIDLFGKSGAELIPVLNGGAAGFKAAQEQAELYHLAIGPQAAADAARYMDAQDSLGMALEGLANTVGQALIPALTDIIETITPVIAGISGFVAEHPQAIELVGAFSAALVVAGGVLMGIAVTSLPAVATALTAVGGSVVVATGGIALLVAGIVTFRHEIASVIADVLANFIGVIEQTVSAAQNLASALGMTGLSNTLESARAKVHEAWEATDKFRVSVLDTTDTVGDHERALGKKTKAQEDSTIADEAAEAATKKHKTAIDGIVKSVMGDSDATNDLIAAVHKLQESHVSNEVIAGKLGTRFVEIYTTLKNTGQEIPTEVSEFTSLYLKLKLLHDLGPVPLIPSDLKEETAEYEKEAEAIKQHRIDGIRGIKEAQAQADFEAIQSLNGISFEAVETFGIWLGAQNQVNASQRQSTEISAQLMAEVTGLTVEQVESIRKQAGEADKVTKANEEAAERFKDAWSDAVGNMTAGLSQAFTDALFHGGNFKDSMVDLLKTTGEGMFQSILTGFLSPFTSALSQLGTNLASLLLKVAGIGSGPNGGILGGIAGGSGGLLGGAAGTGGLSGLGSAVGGFLTNPLTAAIAAGIIGTTAWLKSQAHHEANTFVQDFQNPFHAKLASIVDGFNAAYAAGQLGPGDAQNVWDSTHALWAEFLQKGDAFAAGGSDEAKVWGQAKNTLGPIMIQIFSDMEKKVNAVKAAPPAGSTTIPSNTPAVPAIPGVTTTAGGSEPAYAPPLPPTTTIPTGGGTVPRTIVTGVPMIDTPFGPVPAYASGVDWVPRDMLAYIHAGEAVIPREQNEQRLSASSSVLDRPAIIALYVDGKEFLRTQARNLRELIRDEAINFGGA